MSSPFPHSKQGLSLRIQWAVLALMAFGLLVSRCKHVSTEETTDRASREEQIDTATILFGDSISNALEEAKQNDRRVLVYFTGPSCSWCRVMENKTHSDLIVRELASRFVCVKVDIAKSPGVQEDYGVFSIPRTMVLTPDNERVTDCVGFEPPDSHAARLRTAEDSPPLPSTTEGASGTVVFGASVAAADLVFWFVDTLTMEPDERTNDHSKLLSYLRDNGFTPRIKHIPRSQFQSQWDEASQSKKIPDLLIASNRSGLIRQLMAQGVTRDAISTRLKFGPIPAACEDFTMQNVWLFPSSVNHERAEQAMSFLFEPPSNGISGIRRFATQQSKVEAEQFARNVAEWAFGGNLVELRKHWDPAAPQKETTGSDDIQWKQGLEVYSRGVEIAGNDNLTVALVETRGSGTHKNRPDFVSESAIIGSPSVVILKRDNNNAWRVLVAGMLNYDIVVDELSYIMQFAWQIAANDKLANPKILGPPAGELPRSGRQYEWDVTNRNRNHLNLLVECHYNADGTQGTTAISCLPTGASSGQFPVVISCRKTAQVWSISPTGSIAFSDVHEWQPEPRRPPDPN